MDMLITNSPKGGAIDEDKIIYRLYIGDDYLTMDAVRFVFLLGKLQKPKDLGEAITIRKPYIHISFSVEWEFKLKFHK